MVIAQNLAIRIGPKLEEMKPRSLPEVFKQPRGLNNSQNLRKKRKNLDYKILKNYPLLLLLISFKGKLIGGSLLKGPYKPPRLTFSVPTVMTRSCLP